MKSIKDGLLSPADVAKEMDPFIKLLEAIGHAQPPDFIKSPRQRILEKILKTDKRE
jgi:hypothetical protein